MKKQSKASELLWLFGIIFVALGVAVCSKTDLGVSMIAAPAFVVHEAISSLWDGFTVGMTEYIIQGIILIVLCVVVRQFKWTYLLAFAASVIYGYTLNFFLWLLGGVSFDAVWLRWVMLIVGDIITAFGVACFFRTYMPLQVYELFVAELSSKFHFNINKTKWAFDMTLLILSISLAFVLFGDAGSFDWPSIGYSSFHSIGLGTLVTTIINSPLIASLGKRIDRFFENSPRFPKLEKVLK
ncbi:MAG: hypothetical protein IJW78_05640 [Clostridia bacterium]|nr:hypothetical protein [Clostridia bacterium]